MDFSKFIAGVFGIIFIVILYFIIVYALKIMAKDVKSGGNPSTANKKASNRRHIPNKKRYLGIEIVKAGENTSLKVGSVVPIRDLATIGRRSNNTIILTDKYVSGNHARIMAKNNVLILEDLNSTNGTYLNGEKINSKVKLFPKDQIAIGTAIFKVIP